MSPEMRMMEDQYVYISADHHLESLLTISFKVFDYTRAQRRSYYEPSTKGQTTSAHTGATSATAISSSSIDPGLAKVLTGGRSLPDHARSATPSERTGVVSRTGLDVEAQILDGGGMANTGGRGGWRSSELDIANKLRPESVEMRPTGSNDGSSPMRKPTPLRAAST
jgi:serine/threonine kinase 32